MDIYPDYSISYLKENGQTITFTQNIINTIGRTLANISNSNSCTKPFLSYKYITEHFIINFKFHSSLSFNNNFTTSEVLSGLKLTHSFAPGPDGNTYLMIKHLSLSSFINLLQLFNRIWNEENFPGTMQLLFLS